jgi:biotin carboxyl carrier protein
MNASLRIGQTLWLHCEGRTYTISLKADIRGKTHSGISILSGLLKSPMPGRILKIEFKAGDKVQKNQTLCIIEAMKMEYALKAPFTGTVKDIYKKQNDQVVFEEKIILLEEQK